MSSFGYQVILPEIPTVVISSKMLIAGALSGDLFNRDTNLNNQRGLTG
ncbi:MAG: hypothetical protein ABJB76_05785 [Candidatus Nitrosocosmicus sp.]